MEDQASTDLVQLLQAVQRDLNTALADLQKIKTKLGIDQPSPGPGPGSAPGPGFNPDQPPQ